MALNTLDIDERVKQGKNVEASILEKLKWFSPMDWQDDSIRFFTLATDEEDMHLKIDAWATMGFQDRKSVQIKYRETGGDVGIAVLRPWNDDRLFSIDYDRHSLPWDRDMKHMADIYVVQIGKRLIIAPGTVVKRACNIMVDKLRLAGGFGYPNSFTDSKCWGCELRIVRDRGAGYSAGQYKVINYIKPELLLAAGAIEF